MDYSLNSALSCTRISTTLFTLDSFQHQLCRPRNLLSLRLFISALEPRIFSFFLSTPMHSGEISVTVHFNNVLLSRSEPTLQIDNKWTQFVTIRQVIACSYRSSSLRQSPASRHGCSQQTRHTSKSAHRRYFQTSLTIFLWLNQITQSRRMDIAL